MDGVKSTVVLSKQNKTNLERLVKSKQLSSITEGINIAVENFVKALEKEKFKQQMKEASQDPDFIKRTMKAQSDFEFLDCEAIGEW